MDTKTALATPTLSPCHREVDIVTATAIGTAIVMVVEVEVAVGTVGRSGRTMVGMTSRARAGGTDAQCALDSSYGKINPANHPPRGKYTDNAGSVTITRRTAEDHLQQCTER